MIKLEKGISVKARNLRAIELEDTTYGPMLQLTDGLANPWSFGVVKARNILEAIDAIRTFVESHKDYVPSASSRKSKEVELTIEEQKARNKALIAQLAAYNK